MPVCEASRNRRRPTPKGSSTDGPARPRVGLETPPKAAEAAGPNLTPKPGRRGRRRAARPSSPGRWSGSPPRASACGAQPAPPDCRSGLHHYNPAPSHGMRTQVERAVDPSQSPLSRLSSASGIRFHGSDVGPDKLFLPRRFKRGLSGLQPSVGRRLIADSCERKQIVPAL